VNAPVSGFELLVEIFEICVTCYKFVNSSSHSCRLLKYLIYQV
jgi:hypothetical protein